MAQQTINIGTAANDRTGDTWRDAMDKANDNFDELYTDVAAIEVSVAAAEADIVALEAKFDADTYGLASVLANSTETTISTIDTPVVATFTATDELSQNVTISTAGRITYDGTVARPLSVDINTTIITASGSAIDVTVYLAKNGSVIANSARQSIGAGATDPVNTTTSWLLSMATNDYLEIWIENNTDTTNLILQDAVLRVR
jgi:uncharacterized protein YaaN involved in tellurite resistance